MYADFSLSFIILRSVCCLLSGEVVVVIMEKLITKTSKLGWSKQPVVLDTEPDAEEKAKLLLLGKLLSFKTFSRLVVKDIISKAWNTVNEVEVSVVDKNIFLFSFKHEVDMRRV